MKFKQFNTLAHSVGYFKAYIKTTDDFDVLEKIEEELPKLLYKFGKESDYSFKQYVATVSYLNDKRAALKAKTDIKENIHSNDNEAYDKAMKISHNNHIDSLKKSQSNLDVNFSIENFSAWK
ncbi:hypothetical protein [Vibrio sp. F13]|uniref:hypothetical protein n=1 Tax=Vibrio sp. F13 TaxID=2070777 RepID=UPI0010BDE627|nr:hypothetical protein [Vibrio sp. F13]TKF99561.1 hypothetical protein FCV76_18380 [Vibrio sp. F13]